MNVTYGYGWFHAKKQLSEKWDESRARKAHEKRRLYAAVVEQEGAPLCFLEINNKYIGVGFLDNLQRDYLNYSFEEIMPGKLFLSQISRLDFEGNSDHLKCETTHMFEQDGNVTTRIRNFVEDSRSEKESRTDVTANWEPYPEFGQYQSIIRMER